MKRTLLRRVAEGFQAYLTTANGWTRVGNEFMRHAGEWVQVISFNSSRFADRYVPRSSAQFLWLAGPPTASALVQELQNPSGVQRWISILEHDTKRDAIFAAMKEQFRPFIDAPLDQSSLRSLLEEDPAYWPHAYALALMAAADGDYQAAAVHLKAIQERAVATDNEHIAQRVTELEGLLEVRNPHHLRERLRPVAADLLKRLKLPA